MVGASVATLVFARPAAAVPVPYKNCGTSADPIQIQRFDASVWPPQRGHSVTFTLNGTAARNLTVRINLTISPPSGSGFGVSASNVSIPAGPFGTPQGGLTFWVPRSIPAGATYPGHLSMHDQAGTQDLCLDLTVPFK